MTPTTQDAGQNLAEFLRRAKMQQKELAAFLGIEPSYISRMVNGHVGWINGQYFGQIAAKLRLTDEEIKRLNPAAVVEMASPLHTVQGDNLVRDDWIVSGLTTMKPIYQASEMLKPSETRLSKADFPATTARLRPSTLILEMPSAAMCVSGRYVAGDLLYADTEDITPAVGRIYVYALQDSVRVGRLRRLGETLWLFADNTDQDAFPPAPLSDARLLARVHYWQPSGEEV